MDNKVLPQLKPYFTELPHVDIAQYLEARQMISDLFLSGYTTPESETIEISDQTFSSPQDGADIRVRLYAPKGKSDPVPGMLWIHGGGFVLGTPELDEAFCLAMAEQAQCVIASVDYRLAPEYPFPTGLEDCYAALCWLSDNTANLGINPDQLAVAGTSAGGGLCAGVTLLTRDRNGPKLMFHMPLYPMLDHRNTSSSSQTIIDARVWNRSNNLKAWNLYFNQEIPTSMLKYASPALEDDLSGLPPMFTFVGELDPFRDETIDYVQKASQAGVPCEFHLYPGCYHAFDSITPLSDISKEATQSIIDAAIKAFSNT